MFLGLGWAPGRAGARAGTRAEYSMDNMYHMMHSNSQSLFNIS